MARWAFRCRRCRRSLGTLHRSHKRDGNSRLILKPTQHAARIEWRLLAGRWIVCTCGTATKLPECEIRDGG